MSNVADKIKIDTEAEIKRAEEYVKTLKSLQKAVNSSKISKGTSKKSPKKITEKKNSEFPNQSLIWRGKPPYIIGKVI